VCLLKAVNLKKSYIEVIGKLEVLKGLSLEVNSGEMVAITGESGSGKSTLLHVLGMLDKPDEGDIYYSGKKINVYDKKVNEFRNKKVGFVFQFHYLLEDFSAEENVAMPMFLATKNLKKSIKEAQNLLKTLDMFERKEHYPNQLSGGEQQRVAVARALINNPEIIFADEPTGNLDAKHSSELMELLIKFNKINGQTFVIVTHNQDISKVVDKHFILENGVLKV